MGMREPHEMDSPRSGFFYTREKKGGPKIPVRIYIKQVIDPETGELSEPEVHMAEMPDRTIPALIIWDRVKPIPEGEYLALIRLYSGHNEMVMRATKASMNMMEMRFLPPGKDRK